MKIKVWQVDIGGCAFVASCSSAMEELDCTSSQAIGLVEKMAKDYPASKDNPGPMESYGRDYAAGKFGCTFYSSCKKADEEPQKFEKFTKEGMVKFRAEATYKSPEIRLESKDSTTNAVTCVADFNVEMQNYVHRTSITYKIEITADRKLNATVLEIK
jgi:hypothetical protein